MSETLDRVRVLGGELARMAWDATDHGALPLPTMFLAAAVERLAAALERAPTELERREYFHAYRNGAHALQALQDAEATRLRLKLQKVLQPFLALVLCALAACSSSSERPVSDPCDLEGSETDPSCAEQLEPDAGETDAGEQLEPDASAPECLELHPQTAPVPALYRTWGKCEGEITANAEASTPWREHPETGVCTFTCEWSEPTCDVPRLAADEPRCSASYAAKLGALCEQLGGSCQPGSYFEGGPLVAFCVPKLAACSDD